MSNLTIDIFTSSLVDKELSEYKVLAALKNYAEQMHKNTLYPALAELLEIFETLSNMLKKRGDFNTNKSKKIFGVDLKNENFIYEFIEDEEDLNVSKIFDFIEWALPKIKEIVDEGTAIFDFVESQLQIKEIGIVPVYKNEGYFIIPDNAGKIIQVFRFELSNIIRSDIRFKTLKTNLVEQIENESVNKAPETIKLELIKKYYDLPNPATYNVFNDLEMPFSETILPIAKRKIIQHVAA